MNAINVIAPYKHHDMWVCDDPRVGLLQEPFVAGADTMRRENEASAFLYAFDLLEVFAP